METELRNIVGRVLTLRDAEYAHQRWGGYVVRCGKDVWAKMLLSYMERGPRLILRLNAIEGIADVVLDETLSPDGIELWQPKWLKLAKHAAFYSTPILHGVGPYQICSDKCLRQWQAEVSKVEPGATFEVKSGEWPGCDVCYPPPVDLHPLIRKTESNG